MRVCFGGIELHIPEVWNVNTENYIEPDGRECSMIEISAAGSQTQVETGTECKLLTVLTTAKTYEDIDDLLDLVEEHISLA